MLNMLDGAVQLPCEWLEVDLILVNFFTDNMKGKHIHRIRAH